LGSHEGRSAEWTLANALRDGDELVCVDTWSDQRFEKTFDANVGSRARKIKSSTEEALIGMVNAGERFDVIYVDADHDGAAVLSDCVLSWMLLPVGGTMILDDVLYRHPSQPWALGRIDPQCGVDAFLSAYRLRTRLLHYAWQAIVEKVR